MFIFHDDFRNVIRCESQSHQKPIVLQRIQRSALVDNIVKIRNGRWDDTIMGPWGSRKCGAHHDLAAFATFTLPKILKIEFPDRPRLDPPRRLWAGLSTTRGSILTMTLSRDWHRGFMMVQPLKSFESSTVVLTVVPLESSQTYLFFSSSSLLVGATVSIPLCSPPPLIKDDSSLLPPSSSILSTGARCESLRTLSTAKSISPRRPQN